MARLDDVALGLLGIAHAEIVGADHHVALPGELGDGELRLRRLLGEGRHLLFPVDRPVLIREHRKAGPGGVGDREQPGRHDRPVSLLRHHRGIGDPVEPHRVHGGRIGHGDAGEARRVGLEDLVETVDVPTGHQLVGDAGRDRDGRIVLRQRRRRRQPLRRAEPPLPEPRPNSIIVTTRIIATIGYLDLRPPACKPRRGSLISRCRLRFPCCRLPKATPRASGRQG